MKKKIVVFFASFILFVAAAILCTVYLDPFFHYHSPLNNYYYVLNNERSQNIGIAGKFEYDSIITGTSLTEHYRSSEFDSIFGTDSVKLPFAGATFYETAELVRKSFETGHDLQIVFRSLDMNHLTDDKEWVRKDLGVYPQYLYNDNIFDDYQYVCNIDIFMDYLIPMLKKRFVEKIPGGHTSFDDYVYGEYESGDLISEREPLSIADEQKELSEEEMTSLRENVEYNIISLAKDHPETTFIYFIPPYGIILWRDYAVNGDLHKMFETLRISAEMMLECDNIKLYSFADMTEYTTDISLYQDEFHYKNELNSVILQSISENRQLLTKDNFEDYFDMLEEYYTGYDYEKLINENK